MAIQELDELFGRIADPADRTAFEAILERNQSARELATSGVDLYKAFVDGDPGAITRVVPPANDAAAKARPTVVVQPAAQPQFTEAQLSDLVSAKVAEIFGQQLKTDTFTNQVKGLVKSTADELAPGMYERSMRNADELYTVKRSHEREFGADLDMTKFNEFLAANQGKFATLADTHNAFVAEDRIQRRIAQGITEGMAAKATSEVPGSTFSNSPASMAGKFMSANKLTKLESERGPAVDAAAAAFRKLQTGHVN